MRLEILLNGSLEEAEEFGNQDFRLSLRGEDELRIEVVGSEMELFIDLADLDEALGILRRGITALNEPAEFVANNPPEPEPQGV